MKFLGHDIQLAIFDLDGTLLNSTSLWAEIDERFFAKRGKKVPEHYGEEAVHLGLQKAAIWTSEAFFPNERPEDILAEWHQMAVDAYRDELDLNLFAKEILEAFLSRGVKLALATANSKELYEPCLERLKIRQYFDYVIDAHSVKEGKSSSKIYDVTTAHFGLDKEKVVVFEDALEPMACAHNAGYLTIGVYDVNTTKNEQASRQNCDLFLRDFARFEDRIQKEIPLPEEVVEGFRVKRFIDGYEIVGLAEETPHLHIPASLNGKKIYKIGREAFKGATFKTVEIEEGIIRIGVEAFMDLKGAKEIVLPSSVDEISTYAFVDSSFEKIVFRGYVPKCLCPFVGMENLKEIVFPEGWKSICFRCFWLNPSLEELHLPEGMEEVSGQAFNKSDSLRIVHLPKSLRTIWNDAFYRCKKIEKVIYHGTKEDREKLKIYNEKDGNADLLNAEWVFEE